LVKGEGRGWEVAWNAPAIGITGGRIVNLSNDSVFNNDYLIIYSGEALPAQALKAALRVAPYEIQAAPVKQGIQAQSPAF
jgi:hypothetical protein